MVRISICVSALIDGPEVWMHEDGRKPRPTLSNTIAYEPPAFLAAFVGLTPCVIFRTPCVISRREASIRSQANGIPLFAPSRGGDLLLNLNSIGGCLPRGMPLNRRAKTRWIPQGSKLPVAC